MQGSLGTEPKKESTGALEAKNVELKNSAGGPVIHAVVTDAGAVKGKNDTPMNSFNTRGSVQSGADDLLKPKYAVWPL